MKPDNPKRLDGPPAISEEPLSGATDDVEFELANGTTITGVAVRWVEGFLPRSRVERCIKQLESRGDGLLTLGIVFDQVHFLQVAASVNRVIPPDFPVEAIAGYIAAFDAVKQLLLERAEVANK